MAQLGNTPLIGFAGAPFTLAAYMVEGSPSRDHLGPRTMMHADPETWTALANWAADASGMFLRAQLEAGASAAQLFDSWAGSLGLADYQRYVAPASARALDHVRRPRRPADPLRHRHLELLVAMRDVGVDVIGVDYRLPLDEANRRLGGTVPLQGNIDPALLSAPWEVLEAHVREVIAAGASAPGHVVNLGHGVPPETDPEVLTRVVELIHSISPEAPWRQPPAPRGRTRQRKPAWWWAAGSPACSPPVSWPAPVSGPPSWKPPVRGAVVSAATWLPG